MKRLLLLLLFTFVCQLQAQRSDFSTISFEKADNIATLLKGEELNNLSLLAYKLTHKLDTDAERFRAIYFWVCHNIKNDYGLMMKNNRKRKKFKNDLVQLDNWNQTFKKKVFSKLLTQKRTLCSGYTYLIKELAVHAGIECEIVNGYGKTSTSVKYTKMPNHTWNVVKLDGKWYLSDATWSSGYIGEDYLFKFNYNDDFFLMAPKEFANSHRPLDSEWLLLSEASK